MSQIVINREEDISKLVGCHIHAAEFIKKDGVTYLELQVNHITMPKVVKITIHPFLQFMCTIGNMSAFAGICIQTHDVEEKDDD